ncbi:hypothetical protein D3C87_1650710 [compost metagenome]
MDMIFFPLICVAIASQTNLRDDTHAKSLTFSAVYVHVFFADDFLFIADLTSERLIISMGAFAVCAAFHLFRLVEFNT